MDKSIQLLAKLGIANYTQRHLQIVDDFLNGDKKNPEAFLTELGSWEKEDLEIVKGFISEGLLKELLEQYIETFSDDEEDKQENKDKINLAKELIKNS